jgi:TonB family protein
MEIQNQMKAYPLFIVPGMILIAAIILANPADIGIFAADSTQAVSEQTERVPLKVGDEVMESKLVHKVDPIYPEQALDAQLSGIVVLEVTVDEEGYVSDVQVISGHPFLREAAVTAIKQWRFSPTTLDDKAVPVVTTIRVTFAMDGKKAETNIGSHDSSMLQVPESRIVFHATPIDEKGLPYPDTKSFLLPRLSMATPEDFYRWQKMLKAGWPANADKGTPLIYSFVVSETGKLTNFARIQGPEIPDLENELSQMRTTSPGFIGTSAVSSICVIEIRLGPFLQEN